MKATGIVRRVDELGRLVIPKEIRRTMRLAEGTPLEIFTDREGQIILKKYSPMMELGSFAKQYAESVAQTMNQKVAVSDRDQIIAVACDMNAAYPTVIKKFLPTAEIVFDQFHDIQHLSAEDSANGSLGSGDAGTFAHAGFPRAP